MKKYKLVTFDIFDTLLHRRIRAPVDIFEAVRLAVMQNKIALLNHNTLMSFTHDRMRAESEARQHLEKIIEAEGEVSFSEIYDRYEDMTGCEPELRNLLESKELELEKAFLFASDTGLKVFDEMKGMAEQVAFISDMYLPSDWLSTILEEKGFRGASKLPIFVSAEYRKSKWRGTLYQEVAQALGVTPSAAWLHVGDNIHSDISQASNQSISTRFADWAKVDNRRIPTTATHTEYLVRSILDFIDLPQARHFLPSDGYSSIGYRLFGPLIFGFMMWVMARTKEAKLNKLVFIARDGQLPHQLFETLKTQYGLSQVSTSYVYFSRSVGLQFGLKEWDVDQLLTVLGSGRIHRSIESCLAMLGYDANLMPPLLERFGFKIGDIVSKNRRSVAHLLFTTIFDHTLRTNRSQREKFKRYFDTHFSPDEKIGLVDIGWNGNIQRYLISTLDSRYSKDQFLGLYLGLHSPAHYNRERGFNMEGWVSNYGQVLHVQEYLNSGGVELLEFALTADHGTVIGFKDDDLGNISPVLEEPFPEEISYREKAMKVQMGIRQFVKDHKYLLDYYSPGILSCTAWSAPFERLVTSPTPDEIHLLAGLSHSDIAGNTASRLVLAARQDNRTRKSKRLMAIAREQAFWKACFDRLNYS
ncbi:putative glycosyl transferase [Liberibacter crescens BT-1]|uniref:Putative glycosyl transferase n=1 Tax=Liberibacter crescens (strain BT-1) TaxID=1215343 RepID=L0EV02_LIBCB|nr:glycosyl transferase [Liberibacter crescens]AGA64670.1 putative glycosyl transferase [Liberibacter crescens BT-1]AMC12771.1 hypothetical protein RL73_03475 [Liberibacter crescens]